MVQPSKSDNTIDNGVHTTRNIEPPPPRSKRAADQRWSRASTVSLSSTVEVDLSELEVYVPFRPTSQSLVANSQDFLKQEGPTQHHKSDPIPERESVLKAKAEANRVIASTPENGTLEAMQRLATKEKMRLTMLALPKPLQPIAAQDNRFEEEDDGFLPHTHNHDSAGAFHSHTKNTNSAPNAHNRPRGTGVDDARGWQSQGGHRMRRETPLHFGRQDTDDSEGDFSVSTQNSRPFNSNKTSSRAMLCDAPRSNHGFAATTAATNTQKRHPRHHENRRLPPPFGNVGLGGGPSGTHQHTRSRTPHTMDRAASTSMQMMTIAEHVPAKQTHNRNGGTRRSPPPVAYHRPQVTVGFQVPANKATNKYRVHEGDVGDGNVAPRTVVQQEPEEGESQPQKAKHTRHRSSSTFSALRSLVKRPQLVDPLDIAIIRAQPLFNNPRIVDRNGFSIRCDFGWEDRSLSTVGDIVNDRGEVDWDRITQAFDTNVHPLVREQVKFVVKAIPPNWLQMLRSHAKASAALAKKL